MANVNATENIGLTNRYAKAIYEFLSQYATTYREPLTTNLFSDENPKPNEYITYSSMTGNFGGEFTQAITIYSKSTAYSKIMEIVDKLESDITDKGLRLSYDWGIMTIYKGSPFYQDKLDEDDSYRAGYINLTITIYQFDV